MSRLSYLTPLRLVMVSAIFLTSVGSVYQEIVICFKAFMLLEGLTFLFYLEL